MITEKQGYEAMLHMLKIFWEFSGDNSITSVLSRGQYMSNGEPVDSDILFMWEDAVEKLKKGETPLKLTLRK